MKFSRGFIQKGKKRKNEKQVGVSPDWLGEKYKAGRMALFGLCFPFI
jgi:hypothetical protein